ncbi:hypothetical protein PAECIP111892_00779 [Paenibacillus auburnensis]|uniref:HTH araC/xylS-type domain-containing protein n=1 Tax=Paenibacillus auburnensis TaxID=2905649 RepID=A0ABM9BPP1_9BACL|nr:AraC family transcriptional regulator [Paenibacillus auburnensis]CAH1191888.1 hypothetical protein PAECIP111892_00779 [Paenibacillus auburnensis]
MAFHHPSERIKIPPGFWAGLSSIGLSLHEVASQAGLPLTAIKDSNGVTTAQYFAIWLAYSVLVGDISQSIIRLSSAFETAQYPPSVLATYHARNYRDALYRMARYKQMCPPENLHINEDKDSCTIDLNWQSGVQTGPPVLAGITLATLLELGRRGTGQHVNAKLVEFTYPMEDVRALETYFGARIQTGAKHNRLTLHRINLDLPFISYNEELLQILTPVLDHTLDERLSIHSLTGTVKWIMKRSFTAGRQDIQAVASELGMSDRTLQRRLTEEGTSFKQLLTEARHEQALEYLADPSLDIKEVAFLIGYEDQNSFYRAFRLWEGDTPARWRSEHLSPAVTTV